MDFKVKDVIKFVDEKHAIVNGVKYKIVQTVDPFTRYPVFEFVKDR